MESLLPYETILPRNRHTATVIFLHGLGHSNATWRAAMAEAIAPRLPHALWIFPQAPLRYVKRDRQDRTAWFSIDSLPPHPRDFDESGIAESMSSIERIILSQVHSGIDPKRIVLAGFSQGAAISMLTAFTSLHDLGGVACLSGWLPSQVASLMYSTPTMPILWCHGTEDTEIPISMAHAALNMLTTSFNVPGQQIAFRTYQSLSHKLCDQELHDFGSWLRRIVG